MVLIDCDKSLSRFRNSFQLQAHLREQHRLYECDIGNCLDVEYGYSECGKQVGEHSKPHSKHLEKIQIVKKKTPKMASFCIMKFFVKN